MIIFLDVKKQIIFLYDEDEVIKISFDDVKKIREYVDEKSYYITNMIEVNTNDIISLVNNIEGKPQVSEDLQTTDTNLYIHAKNDQIICIPDIEFKFEGKYDCRAYNDEIKTQIEESPIFKSLIKNDKIEIINSKKRRELLKQQKIERDNKKVLQEKKDKQLDSILSDMPAKDITIGDEVDDAETIDMDSEAKGIALKTEVESEAEKNIRIMGIK